MNILFLTVAGFDSVEDRGIYTDLLRKFRNEGHAVYALTPSERRLRQKNGIYHENGITHIKVRSLNIQKTNIFEKGIATILIEYLYLKAIKKYLLNVKFDLVLYSTPPITMSKVINYIKKRDKSYSYLLLKDIFPQNAVDLGFIRKDGILHRIFKRKERKLYDCSDKIGCMSPANVEYLISNNYFLDKEKVEENPNSIQINNFENPTLKKSTIKLKYNIPENTVIFVYGGNLGKPQGIDFLLEVLSYYRNNPSVFFVIAGSGTEYHKIQYWFDMQKPINAVLLYNLNRETYNKLLKECDVGMIFLDKRYTIPNYPSRLLSYLVNSMPVLAATDSNSDIGKIAEENGYGLWVESGDLKAMTEKINLFVNDVSLRNEMGLKGFSYLKKFYTVDQSYNIIMKHFES